jgi:hypothetical protein
MQQAAAHDALDALLEACCCSSRGGSLDGDVREYSVGLLTDPDEEDEACINVLVDILAAALPDSFGAASCEQQTAWVLNALHAVRAADDDDRSVSIDLPSNRSEAQWSSSRLGADDGAAEVSRMVRALRQHTLWEGGQPDGRARQPKTRPPVASSSRGVCSGGSRCSGDLAQAREDSGYSSSCIDDSGEDDDDDADDDKKNKNSSNNNNNNKDDDHERSALEVLRPLCPDGVSTAFLRHVLRQRCGGATAAAADWLLDCGDPLAAQAAWKAARQAHAEAAAAERQERHACKRDIVSRFDLRPVADSSGGGRRRGPAAPLLPAAPPKDAQQQGKVRYRDGQVVSCKGERFIVERAGNEWDGGSRGKVYTKGKRGKGFV